MRIPNSVTTAKTDLGIEIKCRHFCPILSKSECTDKFDYNFQISDLMKIRSTIVAYEQAGGR